MSPPSDPKAEIGGAQHDATPAPAPPGLAVFTPGLHHGRLACQTLLRQALLALTPGASEGAALPTARQVWLADPDFADWPLDDVAVLSALSGWLRQGGRQLRMAGDDFGNTARRHPRFARWRRDWSHAIDVWTPVEGILPPLLRGFQAGPLWLHWLDAPDWRMRCFTDPMQAHALQPQIADFLQRCEPAWPVTSLGL